MHDWFVIAGCPRSGNTLARLMLDSHPQIHCFDEVMSYPILLNGHIPEIEKPIAGFKIPKWSVKFNTAYPMWCSTLRKQGAIIWMVRDVRAVVGSIIKTRGHIGIDGKAWGNRWVEMRKNHDAEFERRYAAELQFAADCPHAHIAHLALSWRVIMDEYTDAVANGWPVLGVQYEELIREPETVGKRMCRHIGVSWDNAMLEHHMTAHDETTVSGQAPGFTDARRAIDDKSVNLWQTRLTDEEIACILAVAGECNLRMWGRHATYRMMEEQASACRRFGHLMRERGMRAPGLSETAKHREQVLRYCTGNGVDLGAGGDPVMPSALAIDRDPKRAQWVGDGKDLSWLHDGVLGYVYSSHLLEDFPEEEQEGVLREWMRVVRPGGHLVILTADRERFRAAVAAGQPDNPSHRHEGSVGELTAVVERIGGWEVLEDRYASESDYGILFVARKLQ